MWQQLSHKRSTLELAPGVTSVITTIEVHATNYYVTVTTRKGMKKSIAEMQTLKWVPVETGDVMNVANKGISRGIAQNSKIM